MARLRQVRPTLAAHNPPGSTPPGTPEGAHAQGEARGGVGHRRPVLDIDQVRMRLKRKWGRPQAARPGGYALQAYGRRYRCPPAAGLRLRRVE